jgi:hypothetical protein
MSYAATMGHLGETSIGVTVTLEDAKAKLTVNGLAAASGVASNVALDEGANTIRVLVTAEDGASASLTTVTVNKLPFNTRVVVLNGQGGVPLDDTVLTLTDNRGNVILESVPLPKEKNGKPVFGLERGKKYNIYATGTGGAMSCLANFDPAMEDTAELFCLRTSSTYYEYEAPIIETIEFAPDGSSADWKTMSNDAYYVGPLANVAVVRATILTRNFIAGSDTVSGYPDAVGNHPMRVNVDRTASPNLNPNLGAAGTPIGTVNARVTIDGKQYYRSQYSAVLPLITTAVFNKEHFLSVVAYDCNANRTEQRVYLTITDSTNSTASDFDLSAIAPSWDAVQGQTWVGGGDYAGRPGNEDSADAMDPVGNYNGNQQALIQFYVRAAGSTANIGVRGYEVWRSMGNQSSFAKIATVNYAALTTGAPFQYVDRSPTLEAGDVYYKIRAFAGNPANNGFSLPSPSVRVIVMPSTIVRPAASHKQVSDKLWPQFRIAASNPSMLTKETTDEFAFTIFVKFGADPYPFMEVPFYLNFGQTDNINSNPDDPANQHRYGFPLGKPTLLCRTGFTYSTSTGALTGGSWSYASDAKEVTEDGVDEDGNPITVTKTVYTPFAYLDDDGSVVVDTGSEAFQKAMDNAVRTAYGLTGMPFDAGNTYYWNIFGTHGGVDWGPSGAPGPMTGTAAAQAAHFGKGTNANSSTFLGVSYGSHLQYGFGSPEGWFPLIIAPDAK